MANTETLTWTKSVKCAMVKKDIAIKSLAEKLGYSREYLSAVINGRVYSQEVVSFICDELDIEDNFSFQRKA